MSSSEKTLYKLQRLGNSLFTYDCVSCKKSVGGKCLCEKCSEKLEPCGNYLNGSAYAFYYDGPARDVILRFKFGSDYKFCYDTLCDWLMIAYEKLGEKDFDAVVPVPSFETDKTKLYYLTKKFSVLKDLPFEPKLLHKIRKTEKQHSLSAAERRINLIGAFEAESSVCGKKILLVDDIFTTGSTVNECANALYNKGAEKVFIITALKTRYNA